MLQHISVCLSELQALRTSSPGKRVPECCSAKASQASVSWGNSCVIYQKHRCCVCVSNLCRAGTLLYSNIPIIHNIAQNTLDSRKVVYFIVFPNYGSFISSSTKDETLGPIRRSSLQTNCALVVFCRETPRKVKATNMRAIQE